MDPDKELSHAAERLNATLSDEPIPASPRPPRRPWFATALAAAALTLGVFGIAYIALASGGRTDAAADTSTTTTTTTTIVETTVPVGQQTYSIFEHEFTVQLPKGWRDASETLAPALAPGNQSLYEVLSVGTFEMRAGGEHCDYLPENAMRDMGPTDVLVTFRFNGSANSPAWPELFGPDSWLAPAPASDIGACTDRDDLDHRWALHTQNGQGVAIMAVFGDEVSDQTVLETYAVINSFEIDDPNPAPDPYDPGYIQSWSMAYGPDWYRADGGELMPNLGGDSITLATFSLRPGGDRCAHMPENALRDLGPEDALISVFLGWHGLGEPWPTEGFNDTNFPASPNMDAHECAERPDLEVHWDPWFNAEGHFVLVAFGDKVTEERRAETWAVLSSLQPELGVPAAPDRGICVSTRPPVPGLVPPDRWPVEPSDPESVWYGTPDLWTPMRSDGMYQERKSVWWSQNFTDAGRESSPAIAVSYDRIDRPAPSVVVAEPGTNAFTAQDGLFMIASIEFEPPTPGCWLVTGYYKDATLSYVINVP